MTKFYQSIEHFIAKIMFFLTIFFLSLIAIIIQYLQVDNGLGLLPFSQQIIAILFIIWPLFFFERLLYLIFCDKKTWKSYLTIFIITFLPPLRLAARRCDDNVYIWWNNNWQLVNESLYEYFERLFLYPILFISLIMIPFWITEIFFSQRTNTHLLYHLMNLGNAIVWELFVTEFIIMFSITNKRNQYLMTHWLELFIIILPMLALTRFFMIPKYLQLSKTSYVLWFVKVQDMLNIYRARVVVNRIIRIFIIIDIFKRFYQRKNPEKYLEILRCKLAEQEQEIIELKKQITEVETLIGKNRSKK